MGIEVLIKMFIRNPDSQGVVIVRAGWLTLRYANTVSYPASFLKNNRKVVKVMPRGKKTSPEVVYKIMTSWAITSNYKETARELELPVTTVKSIVDNNKDKPEFVKLRDEKRNTFSEKANTIIDKALKRLERELDNEDKDIPVNHLTTVIGTMYDKKALADGDATERMSIEIKMPDGVDEYAE